MSKALVLALGISGLLLAGCAPQGGPQASRSDPGVCVSRFEAFDFAKQSMSTPTGRSDQMAVPIGLQSQVAALRQHDCMTRPGDLTLSGEVVPLVESGASIRPATIHAGVLTDMSAEGPVRAYFEARGIDTLTVGQAGLGRRVYIGAFTTAGGRDAALATARAAGFASPYVITYGPYMRP